MRCKPKKAFGGHRFCRLNHFARSLIFPLMATHYCELFFRKLCHYFIFSAFTLVFWSVFEKCALALVFSMPASRSHECGRVCCPYYRADFRIMSSKRSALPPQRDEDDSDVQEELRQELVREMLALQAQKAALEAEKARLVRLQAEEEERQRLAATEVADAQEEQDALSSLGVSSVEQLMELQQLLQQLRDLTAERDRLMQEAAAQEEVVRQQEAEIANADATAIVVASRAAAPAAVTSSSSQVAIMETEEKAESPQPEEGDELADAAALEEQQALLQQVRANSVRL